MCTAHTRTPYTRPHLPNSLLQNLRRIMDDAAELPYDGSDPAKVLLRPTSCPCWGWHVSRAEHSCVHREPPACCIRSPGNPGRCTRMMRRGDELKTGRRRKDGANGGPLGERGRLFVGRAPEGDGAERSTGEGKLGTGEIWNGKIWHNSVPNYATGSEGLKPFFWVSVSALSACTFPLCPTTSIQKRPRNNRNQSKAHRL